MPASAARCAVVAEAVEGVDDRRLADARMRSAISGDTVRATDGHLRSQQRRRHRNREVGLVVGW